jgi:hypothetical protein
MLKFYLQGVEIENPKGWDDITVRITRDQFLNYSFLQFQGQLVFMGNAYEMLKTAFDTDGFCESRNLEIWITDCNTNSFKKLAEFKIFLSDIEFNLFKCQATTELIDNNWGSYINNNKQIEATLSSPLSKNGTNITPAQIETFETFEPSTGTYIKTAQGHSFYESFKYLISFMSDGNIQFVSNYFTTGSGKDYTICTGYSLRSQTYSSPVTSFWNLYSELNKKLKLGITYFTIGGTNYVQIEDYNYFLQNGQVVLLENIKDILLKANNKEMYAALKSGSTIFNEIGQCDNGNTECTFSQIPFFTWAINSLATTGECNIDNVADLVTANNYIIDTNLIEDLVVYGNDDNDRNIVIVSIDRSTMKAKQTDFFGINKYWYNDSLANYNVFINWFQGLNNFSSQWLQQSAYVDIYAGVIAQTYCCNPLNPGCSNMLGCTAIGVQFDDVFSPYYDSNGYNNGGLFIAPFSGNYEIQFELTYEDNITPGTDFAASYWDLTAGSGVLPGVFVIMPHGGPNTVTSNIETVFLTQGHKYVVYIQAWNGELNITGGWLKIKAILPNPFPNVPTSNFLAKEYEFEKYISLNQLSDIIQNPSSKVEFNGGGLLGNESGWMKDVSINLKTLKGNFVLGAL